MSKYVVLAAVVAAIAVSACRREMPHPNGLGASELAPQQQVLK